MLSGTCLEAFLHGNLTSQDALTLAQELRATLGSQPLAANQRPEDRVFQLPAGQALCHRSASLLLSLYAIKICAAFVCYCNKRFCFSHPWLVWWEAAKLACSLRYSCFDGSA